MASRESTEAEMRRDGIEKPKGIYCQLCGHYWEDWDRFFQHHKAKHPWIDPEGMKAIMEEADRYVEEWRKLIGVKT